jgi:YbbR domain-containing protein
LEKEETKKFPIIPTTTGTVRDGYALGKIEAVPEKVSIRGPKSVIKQISRVEASVNVSGLSQNQVLPSELVLYDKNNDKLDQKLLTNNIGSDGVGVSVQILHTAKVPLEFNTSKISTAKGYEFIGITYEPMEVLLEGEKEVLEKLRKIYIPGSALAMSSLMERTEKVIDISSYLPNKVQLVDENAGSVVVTINVEKDGTKSYDITEASIAVNNLAKDLQMSYTTADAIIITLRGPDIQLEAFDANTNVSIDLESYTTPGEYKVPVHVDAPDSCKLENEVFVMVNLRKIE